VQAKEGFRDIRFRRYLQFAVSVLPSFSRSHGKTCDDCSLLAGLSRHTDTATFATGDHGNGSPSPPTLNLFRIHSIRSREQVSGSGGTRARPTETSLGMASFVGAQLDFYAVLGVDRTASTAEVNAAFRHLAWRYHPDRNSAPGATEQFQNINEARQALSDPVRRSAYDARWHPASRARCRTSPTPLHPHSHRTSHRKQQARRILLTLLAAVLVSSGWLATMVVITAMHRPDYESAFDASWPPAVVTSQNCMFSVETSPFSYADTQGGQFTPCETAMRGYWIKSIRVSSFSNLQP
jgi:curved DNA-binding protein CbpA